MIGSSAMAKGWNGPAPPDIVFRYHLGRKGAYADQTLTGFDGIIQGEVGQQLSRPLVDAFFARAYCPGQARVAQIRSGQGHGLYAETPGRLSPVPCRWPRRHRLEPGRERNSHPRS